MANCVRSADISPLDVDAVESGSSGLSFAYFCLILSISFMPGTVQTLVLTFQACKVYFQLTFQ